MKQRFILAEFPITKDGHIAFNKEVVSKEIGLRKAARVLGPLTPIKVAEMDGVQTTSGKRFMIFFGEKEKQMLVKWLVDGMDEQGLL